jgi:hypothetical protein
MSGYASIPSLRVLVLFPFLAGFVLPAGAATDARLSESYGKLPLQFEANRGQTHNDVRFLSRAAGYGLYLTSDEAVLVLSKPKTQDSVALRMSLVGAARKPAVSGLDELPGKSNYFIGKDPSKWRGNVPTYAKVHYRNVYPGIDLVYYGNQRQLEYDLVVTPGADPKKIVLGFKGADKLGIDAQGDLVLHTKGGDIRQHKPVVYQEIGGSRKQIDGRYLIKGRNRVGFKLAAYDRGRPLVIDPVLALAYSTYLGGSFGDEGSGIAVDAAGNAYVTGDTGSINFPTTPGAFNTTTNGQSAQAFVTKLDPTGSTLVYSTYLGGSGGASGTGIAVDSQGNAYVTGTTLSTDFPTTAGAFQTTSRGSTEVFVTKLDPTGSALVYSTYLGGTGQDTGAGIAVDGSGSTYVTGTTASSDFPTTSGAAQPVFAGPGATVNGVSGDAFVTKLDPTGSTLAYSTYLGGADRDVGSGIAVDATGKAYVTGATESVAFPTTPGAFQPIFGGGVDAFVTKIDPTAVGPSSLVYSTYLGGILEDEGSGITVDAAGNAYVTGDTNSVNFPTTAGALQPTFGGGFNDAFVAKLNPSALGPLSLVYSTYLGGSAVDVSSAIAVDTGGNMYVTGGTSSPNFPTTAGAFQSTLGGGGDAFVTKIDPTAVGPQCLVYSTYLGGSGLDGGAGIAVDAGGNAYVTGETRTGTAADDFPTTAGAFQTTFGGNMDAFVVKITAQ